jgi:membrane peptidoglycan carboxypeptidase
MTAILDGKGANFADVFEPSNRRIWVSLDDIPESVRKAFVAAEDRRFYQHHGVDERGIIRAFMGNLGESGRPQGGSTITQQVVKNLLVGEDVTYERKIREIIVASRVESTLTKAEILELYLNSAYLGRSSWGVEMAARSAPRND